MADLAVTPASVAKGAGAQLTTGTPPIAGALIAAGTSYYIKASDGKAYPCQCNTATASVPEASWAGIALATAQIGQPVIGQTSGNIFLSCTTVKGTVYVLSTGVGKICPVADLLAAQTPPHNLTLVGIGVDLLGTLQLHNYSSGIAL
jgi:hypothetical protein